MKYSLVADHWQYAALIVPCAAAAALLTTLGRHLSPLARSGRGAGGEGETEGHSRSIFQKPLATYALGLVLLAILAVLTFRQSRMFAGEETLYRTAIPEAVQTARAAVDLATQQNSPALAAVVKARLQLYETGTPYRQPPPASTAPATQPGLSP